MSPKTKLFIITGVLCIVCGGLYLWHVMPRQIPVVPVVSDIANSTIANQTQNSPSVVLAKKISSYVWTAPEYIPADLVWQQWVGTSASELFSRFGIEQYVTGGEDGVGSGECVLRGDLLYVRYEGGRCGVGYWFVRTSDGFEIRNETDFLRAITPVRSVEAAVAAVYGLINDIARDENTQTFVTTVSDGYLVHVINNNTFGCSMHEPFGQVFLVTLTGVVREVAREPEPEPDPNIPIVCVD